MSRSPFFRRPPGALAVLLGAASLFGPEAFAQDDGNVLYLSEYLSGDFHYAPLGDIDGNNPRMIRPRRLRLPGRFRASVELGNQDVALDGTRIVFAARNIVDLDWDIYAGIIDLDRRRIHGVERIIRNVATRDEDPRFSWDGSQIIYKCDGNICIYPGTFYPNPVVSSSCELWAPAVDGSGYIISYAQRCGAPDSDRIWYYNLLTAAAAEVPNDTDTPDRFAYFLDDGRIVYSHADSDSGRSSLWVFDGSGIAMLHDRTESDDDPYPDKHDRNHIAFIGWQDGGYDLFVYRQDRDDSVQLTRGIPVIAPVLFR